MKLCIGSISGRGTVCVEFLQSVFAIQKDCISLGIETDLQVIAGALVEDARNDLVSRYMASGADVLFMMDDDMYLDVRVFRRMLAFKRGVVGCFSPQRRFDLEAFAQLIRQGLGSAEAESRAYPLVGPNPDGASQDAISEVEWIGTGILLIRRFVFEKIIADGHVSEERFNTPEGSKRSWNFFTRLPASDGMGQSGEDVSFCTRVRQAGIPIFAYRGPGIFHIGSHQFGTGYS